MYSDRKARRGGRKPLPAELRRTHSVNCRLNGEELSILDSKRGKRQRGEWLRMAALDRLPPIISSLNKEKWAELGRLGSNINRILISAEGSGQISPELNELIAATLSEIQALRSELLSGGDR